MGLVGSVGPLELTALLEPVEPVGLEWPLELIALLELLALALLDPLESLGSVDSVDSVELGESPAREMSAGAHTR